MARWYAVVTLAEAPDRETAWFEAVAEFGAGRVVLVQSQVSYEMGLDELRAHRRNRQLGIADYEPNSDEGPES